MTHPRASPLAHVAVPGRYGAGTGEPGVTLSVRHPVDIVTVIARKYRATAVLAALHGFDARWAGPDQYFVVGASYDELKPKLAGIASLSDQSHGRVIIRIEGTKSREVLAKGTPVDLHTDEFTLGKSALTQMAHVGVHVTRVGRDAFEVSVFRGFAESFWEWLTSQSAPCGYQIRLPEQRLGGLDEQAS